MNPNKIIGVIAIAVAPIIITTEFVRDTKKKVAHKIDEVQYELHNPRHFAKKRELARKAKKNK
jgi:hypothetical protein